jgi:hypothetical protein
MQLDLSDEDPWNWSSKPWTTSTHTQSQSAPRILGTRNLPHACAGSRPNGRSQHNGAKATERRA